MLQIKHSLSTPYSPWVNGCVERMNGTIAQLLSSYSNGASDWDIVLPFALFAYRTSTHSATGFSPFFLMHGREATVPCDTSLQQWESFQGESRILARTTAHNLKMASEQMQKAKEEEEDEKKRKHTGSTPTPTPFKPGDHLGHRRSVSNSKWSHLAPALQRPIRDHLKHRTHSEITTLVHWKTSRRSCAQY